MKKVLISMTQNELGFIIIVFGGGVEGLISYCDSIKPSELYLIPHYQRFQIIYQLLNVLDKNLSKMHNITS